jgi:tetratricopeptide (TPR) repeat protein
LAWPPKGHRAQRLGEAESILYEALSVSHEEELAAFLGPYHELADLLHKQNRAVELIAIGEDLLSRSASATVVRRLLESAASLALTPGTSRSVAKTALGRLSQLDPTDLSLVRRVLFLAAQAGDWDLVTTVLNREVELARSDLPEAAPWKPLLPMIWWEIGEVARRHLDRPDAALTAYQRAMESQPAPFFVSSAMARLLLEEQRWGDLTSWYERDLARESDPVKLARMHVSSLHEFHRLT